MFDAKCARLAQIGANFHKKVSFDNETFRLNALGAKLMKNQTSALS